MKFRKKPVVIEAVLIADVIHAARSDWKSLPAWVGKAYEAGAIVFLPDHVSISTLEGVHRAEREDWLIRGVKGELYPCKPDIFEMTYERVS